MRMFLHEEIEFLPYFLSARADFRNFKKRPALKRRAKKFRVEIKNQGA